MKDFAAELRAAREPLSYEDEAVSGERAGGFESYLLTQGVNRGFELGYEAGTREATERFRVQVASVREQSRLDGFDAGARVVLRLTLLGLQEVVGELESRRAHKVMLEKARERLGELVERLDSVHAVLPLVADASGQQAFEGLGVLGQDMMGPEHG